MVDTVLTVTKNMIEQMKFAWENKKWTKPNGWYNHFNYLVLSICYLAYKVLNDQRNEDEDERQALLASIKELEKRGRPKKSKLPEV